MMRKQHKSTSIMRNNEGNDLGIVNSGGGMSSMLPEVNPHVNHTTPLSLVNSGYINHGANIEGHENLGGPNKKFLEPILNANQPMSGLSNLNGAQRDFTKSGNLHAPNIGYEATQ